jgi:Na+-translocating ferredoxin:NAD+ oxidoreductase RnfG subunit
MSFKSVLTKLFILLAIIFAVSASYRNNEPPAELSTSIQKRWPSSKTVLISQQSGSQHITPFYKIISNNDTLGWAYISRVFSCRVGGCENVTNLEVAGESNEYFDYFAILDKKKNILEIKVYNYAATHGAEVCSKGWLKQFKGYNGSKALRYGKDIDAISGATISGTAITGDVTKKMSELRKSH